MKIKHLTAENILSFGSGDDRLDMDFGDMNVIVGPNNSGKTNVFRILGRFYHSIKYSHFNGEIMKLEEMKHYGTSGPSFVEVTFVLDRMELKKIDDFFASLISESKDRTVKGIISSLSKGRIELAHEKTLAEGLSSLIERIWSEQYEELRDTLFRNHEFKCRIDEQHRFPIFYFGDGLYSDATSNYITLPAIGERGQPQDLFIDSYFEAAIMHYLREMGQDEPGVESAVRLINNFFNEEYEPLMDFLLSSRLNKTVRLDTGLSLKHGLPFSLPSLLEDIIVRNLVVSVDSKCISRKEEREVNVENLSAPLSYDSSLPSILFHMKNSTEFIERERFFKVRRRFQEYTGMSFDVVEVTGFRKKEAQSVVLEGMNKEVADGDHYYLRDYKLVLVNIQNIDNFQCDFEYTGAGYTELLYLLTLAYGREGSIVFLDEPAANIHPSLQKELLNGFVKAVKDRNMQFVLITHSPYLVPDIPEEGSESPLYGSLKVFYTYLNQRGHLTTIHELAYTRHEKAIKHINRHKEVLFSDFNVIVEGITDIYLLNALIQRENLMAPKIIQLVEAGSGDAIKSFVSLLNAFGISTVGIVDRDKRNQVENNDKTLTSPPRIKDKILILPSDIEGTFVLGSILFPLELELGAGYMPKDEGVIEKLSSDKNLDQLNLLGEAIEQAIESKTALPLKPFFSSPDNESLDSALQVLSEDDLNSALKKLKKYLEIRREFGNGGKPLLGKRMAEEDVFLTGNEVFIGRLTKFLTEVRGDEDAELESA